MTAPNTDRPRLLVAFVSENDELQHVYQAALDVAAREGFRLILYDRDAGAGLSAPMPTNWSASGEPQQYGDPLSDRELEKLGRAELASKVAAAQAAGVDAWGWLPDTRNTADFIDYAHAHGAEAVALPAEEDHPGLLDRVRGETVGTALHRAAGTTDHLTVLLVEPGGQVQTRRPSPSSQPEV